MVSTLLGIWGTGGVTEDGQANLRARVGQRVADALQNGRARRVTGTALLAGVAAAALAPVVDAGITSGPVVLASVGVAGGVGGNILTDFIKSALERLRGRGEEASEASVEAEFAASLEEVLSSPAELSPGLRKVVAAILRSSIVVDVAAKAAARDEQLRSLLSEGFEGLSGQFSEFGDALGDLGEAVQRVEATLGADNERHRQQALDLGRISEVVERLLPSGTAGALAGDGADRLWQGCPYLGLVPFEEQDARVFYGRKDLTGRLVRRLAERLDAPGILLLVGPSGAGKSSLLRAGLMPRLAGGTLGPGSQRWPRRMIRPAGQPLLELAAHLARLAGTDPEDAYLKMRRSPDYALVLAEQAIRAAAGPDSRIRPQSTPAAAPAADPRLVLVIDQLEELFPTGNEVSAEARAERDVFLAALDALAVTTDAARGVPWALVAAAVRSDYLDQVIAYPALAAALDAGPFSVGPMSEGELRQAITGPAAEASLSLDSGLADTVVADLRAGGLNADARGGALPLLSQAMAATWEKSQGGPLTVSAYRRAGGITNAVNNAAQSAYESLTRTQQSAARFVFTQLVDAPSPEGGLTRRRCARDDLFPPDPGMAGDTARVIDVFTARRLLVSGEDGVEIAHDELLRAWKQLLDWFGEDPFNLALYSQLKIDAHTWNDRRRAAEYLYRPGRLATVEAAVAQWSSAPGRWPLTVTVAEFLAACRQAARRARRRLRLAVAFMAVLAIAASASAVVASRNEADAVTSARIALSRQLAAESLSLASGDPTEARRLAAAAWYMYPTDQADSVINVLQTEQQEGVLPAATRFAGVTFQVKQVAFGPGGLLATGGSDGRTRVWDPATGRLIRTISTGAGSALGGVRAVAFSPRGLLATVDGDARAQVWDPVTGRLIVAIPTHDTNIGQVAFSSGGLLATGEQGGVVQVWNPATGQLVRTLSSGAVDAGNDEINDGVAFSPGGLLAAVYDDGNVRVWDPASGRLVRTLHTGSWPSGPVVAFSPGGLLAIGEVDGTVRLWDPASGRLVSTLGVPNDDTGQPDVALSSGGLLATIVGDGTVRIWNMSTHRLVRTINAPGSAIWIAFSPAGLLATADGDGTARVWNAVTGQAAGGPPSVEAGGDVNGVAFSPAGLLATADNDGTLRVRNAATGRLVRTLNADSSGVNDAAFGLGGVLATADDDGTVRIWNAATGQLVRTLHADPDDPSEGITTEGSPGVDEVRFGPGGLLATADGDGAAQVWNFATGQLIKTFSYPGSDGRGQINGVAFAPAGLLATADSDGTAQVWDPVSGRLVRTINADSDEVYGVAFSPDGLLATADGDGTARVWNPVTGQLMKTFTADTSFTGAPVYSVAFSSGGLLATADGDGTARVWNLAADQAAPAIDVDPAFHADPVGGAIKEMTFSPDGGLLVTTTQDSGAQLWGTSLFANAYQAICADVGPLTPDEWTSETSGEPYPKQLCAPS